MAAEHGASAMRAAWIVNVVDDLDRKLIEKSFRRQ
jgi:hypothetical protein